MQWKSGGWRENIELLSEIVKIQPMLPTSPSQRAPNRNLHILCVQFTLLKTMWNQLMKWSTIFSFQFFFVRRDHSLMSCENHSPFPPAQGALGIPHLKAETSQQYAASKLIRAPHNNNNNNNNNNSNLIFILRKIHVNMIKCALHESKQES